MTNKFNDKLHTTNDNDDKRKIEYLCLEAEQLTLDVGPERSIEALQDLANVYPHYAAPRISLAKVFRWLAIERNVTDEAYNRGKLRTAADFAKSAVEAEDPLEAATLDFAGDILHLLAVHQERGCFFCSVADKHSDPAISFKALIFAAVSFQCHGYELDANGKKEEATAAYHDSVNAQQRALQTWPQAPIFEKVSSYFQGGHVYEAYSQCSLADKWAKEVEELLSSEEGLTLPGEIRAEYLGFTGEMAVKAGLYQKGVDLAEKAVRVRDGGQSACKYRLGMINSLGRLLIVHSKAGNESDTETVAKRIEEILHHWEANVEEDCNLSIENRLPAAYNYASAMFVIAEDWERAIPISKRAIELWNLGTHHWFLAVSLWMGCKDRDGTLNALRNCAQDKLISGHFQCRNLMVDFRNCSYFKDVQEDKDFLESIKMQES